MAARASTNTRQTGLFWIKPVQIQIQTQLQERSFKAKVSFIVCVNITIIAYMATQALCASFSSLTFLSLLRGHGHVPGALNSLHLVASVTYLVP